MTRSPLDTALLDILTPAHYLLLDFDGPICDVYDGLPAATVAERLRNFAILGVFRRVVVVDWARRERKARADVGRMKAKARASKHAPNPICGRCQRTYRQAANVDI